MLERLNNGDKTVEGKFALGNAYGKGRPKGSRNKASLMAEAMLDNEAEALTRKLLDIALSGDLTAIKLCLERILPPRKERSIVFEFPEINTSQDVANARASILDALSVGDVTSHEAINLCALIDDQLKSINQKNRDEAFPSFF